MESGTLIKSIAGIAICLVLITAVAVPIISDITDDISSINTNPIAAYDVATANEGGCIVEVSPTKTILINGVEYTDTYYVISNNMYVYASPSSGIVILDETNNLKAALTEVGDKVVYEKGTVKYSTSGVEKTSTYEILLYPSENGTWGYWTYPTTSKTVYVDAGQQYYLATNSFHNALTTVSIMKDNKKIDDLIKPVIGSGSEITIQEGTVNWSESAGLTEDGLSYKFTDRPKMTFSPTAGGEDVPVGGSIIAPKNFHYISSIDETTKSIIMIIPILIVVSALVAVVGVFVYNRN